MSELNFLRFDDFDVIILMIIQLHHFTNLKKWRARTYKSYQSRKHDNIISGVIYHIKKDINTTSSQGHFGSGVFGEIWYYLKNDPTVARSKLFQVGM